MIFKTFLILALGAVFVAGRPQGDVPIVPADPAAATGPAPSVQNPDAPTDAPAPPPATDAPAADTAAPDTPAPTDAPVVQPETEVPVTPAPAEGGAVSTGPAEWQLNGFYKTGDLVTFAGDTYRCVSQHRADAFNWTPPNVPALWTKISA